MCVYRLMSCACSGGRGRRRGELVAPCEGGVARSNFDFRAGSHRILAWRQTRRVPRHTDMSRTGFMLKKVATMGWMAAFSTLCRVAGA